MLGAHSASWATQQPEKEKPFRINFSPSASCVNKLIVAFRREKPLLCDLPPGHFPFEVFFQPCRTGRRLRGKPRAYWRDYIFPFWPGTALGSFRRSWTVLLGWGMSGFPLMNLLSPRISRGQWVDGYYIYIITLLLTLLTTTHLLLSILLFSIFYTYLGTGGGCHQANQGTPCKGH